MILADFCKNNYKKHADELVIELERKCDLMMQCLDMEFGSIAEFTKPKGGIFIWITFFYIKRTYIFLYKKPFSY